MSKTFIAEIKDSTFPTITVPPGTYVVWRNLDPYVHSVETLPTDPNYFNAGAMLPTEASSPILFSNVGSYSYLCRFHMGMIGSVNVTQQSPGAQLTANRGHSHGLHHYHGFVTGGWSGERLYMTHTPVLADERHNYQVVLRSRFVKQKHVKVYESLRSSAYGDQVVQIFHDHVSMPDIGMGKIKTLPHASVSYWPGGSQTSIGPEQVDVPGLEDVPVEIEEVLHFHQFDTEADYPSALTYILYGDADDTFIDHFINRAPSFHSVARLASPPDGWSGSGATMMTVPGHLIRNIEPRLISRIAMVDNAFHLFWLLPPGTLPRQSQDPLIRRDNAPGANHVHPVVLQDGRTGQIEISRFLHFDIRLLNYGVLIV